MKYILAANVGNNYYTRRLWVAVRDARSAGCLAAELVTCIGSARNTPGTCRTCSAALRATATVLNNQLTDVSVALRGSRPAEPPRLQALAAVAFVRLHSGKSNAQMRCVMTTLITDVRSLVLLARVLDFEAVSATDSRGWTVMRRAYDRCGGDCAQRMRAATCNAAWRDYSGTVLRSGRMAVPLGLV